MTYLNSSIVGYIWGRTLVASAHARCWSHCRRKFVDARQSDPQGVAAALLHIGALYRHEKIARKKKLEGLAKLVRDNRS